MGNGLNVAVVGANAAVGEAVLALLAQRKFACDQVYALAAGAASGGRVEFGDGYLRVQPLDEFDFSKADLALFVAGAAVAGEYAPRAVAAGCLAIDGSGRFAADPQCPLVVPEVNPTAIATRPAGGIIASPGSAAVALLVAVKPLYDAAGIERIDVATYQAVSGSGKAGIDELAGQSAMLLNGCEPKRRVYPKQIAFNCLPQIGEIGADGYSGEERALIDQTRRVLGDECLSVAVTAVQVPVFYGHSLAVHLQAGSELTAGQARELLTGAAGVTVLDERGDGGYPTVVTEAVRHDTVFVGRIREDGSRSHGLNLWVVADNVRKGAALNCVQIAELLARDHW